MSVWWEAPSTDFRSRESESQSTRRLPAWLSSTGTEKVFESIAEITRDGGQMAVRLRLQRHGTKKHPFYRVVAADGRNKRDGRFIEVVGTYNPIANPAIVELKIDRIDHWLTSGALMSDTVATLVTNAKRAQ